VSQQRDPRKDPVDWQFVGAGIGMSAREWIFYVIGPAVSVTFFIYEFVLLPASRGELW
jgi:hypothetical protein